MTTSHTPAANEPERQAPRLKLLDDAHYEAGMILAAAREEGDRLLEHVRSEIAIDKLRLGRSADHAATPIHSNEISTREFRRTFRGLDAEAVRDWLRRTEASHAALEDELERLRWGWDELLIVTARLRSAPSGLTTDAAGSGDLLAQLMTAGRPQEPLASANTGPVRDALAGAVRGRRRTQAALAEAGVQLARMQHGTALLQRSNERLRTQLIESLSRAPAS